MYHRSQSNYRSHCRSNHRAHCEGWSDSRVCHNAQSNCKSCCSDQSCGSTAVIRAVWSSTGVGGSVALSSGPASIFVHCRMLNSVVQSLAGIVQAPACCSDLYFFRIARETADLFQIFYQCSRILQFFRGDIPHHWGYSHHSRQLSMSSLTPCHSQLSCIRAYLWVIF